MAERRTRASRSTAATTPTSSPTCSSTTASALVIFPSAGPETFSFHAFRSVGRRPAGDGASDRGAGRAGRRAPVQAGSGPTAEWRGEARCCESHRWHASRRPHASRSCRRLPALRVAVPHATLASMAQRTTARLRAACWPHDAAASRAGTRSRRRACATPWVIDCGIRRFPSGVTPAPDAGRRASGDAPMPALLRLAAADPATPGSARSLHDLAPSPVRAARARRVSSRDRRRAQWMARGREHQAQARPVDAMLCYRRALRAMPALAEAHLHLGEVLWQLRRPDEAIDAWREAVRLAPDPAARRISRWPKRPWRAPISPRPGRRRRRRSRQFPDVAPAMLVAGIAALANDRARRRGGPCRCDCQGAAARSTAIGPAQGAIARRPARDRARRCSPMRRARQRWASGSGRCWPAPRSWGTARAAARAGDRRACSRPRLRRRASMRCARCRGRARMGHRSTIRCGAWRWRRARAAIRAAQRLARALCERSAPRRSALRCPCRGRGAPRARSLRVLAWCARHDRRTRWRADAHRARGAPCRRARRDR